MTSNTRRSAETILKNARLEISKQYPLFLDALYQLQLESDPLLPVPLSTNGIQLFYAPELLVEYKKTMGMRTVVYDILHLCSHCILGHIPLRSENKHSPLFDALVDFKVDKLIMGLYPKARPRKKGGKVDRSLFPHPNLPMPLAFSKLKQDRESADTYLRYSSALQIDLHELWHQKLSDPASMMTLAFTWANIRGKIQTAMFMMPFEQDNIWDEAMPVNMLEHTSGNTSGQSAGFGMGACNYTCPPKPVSASSVQYRDILEEFLRKNMVEKESILSIDPMWYHYGLETLGDIPMIEPGEEDQSPAFGTLVVAIDTSGSCQFGHCDRFLEELNQIFRELDLMGSYSSIHLIQCDWEIQEEIQIDSQSDWENALSQFQIKGGGGTSFMPVYERAGELEDVVGLIYLSDADGAFPKQSPPFPSLFLVPQVSAYPFLDQVPYWVQQVYLPYEQDSNTQAWGAPLTASLPF